MFSDPYYDLYQWVHSTVLLTYLRSARYISTELILGLTLSRGKEEVVLIEK